MKHKYFELSELLRSDTALTKKIDNCPTWEIVDHLDELTQKILDPLREAWGRPIRVTSGYRCDALNKAVGGAPTSAHRNGYAADLQDWYGKTEELIAFAKEWLEKSGIWYDQLIRETNGSNRQRPWLHIGLYGSNGCQRRQYLDLIKK